MGNKGQIERLSEPCERQPEVHIVLRDCTLLHHHTSAATDTND